MRKVTKQRQIYITKRLKSVRKQVILGGFFQRETILGPSPSKFLKEEGKTCTERRLELLHPDLPVVGREKNC